MEKITTEHPESKSLDILANNIDKLKDIFPEVVSENRVDFEKLQLLLNDVITPKEDLYGLNWWGKNDAIREAMKPSLGTLRPAKEESVNWDTTENLYIEGDNLEVLKLLQKSYNGKVKMIYIDPPYNTGKDFVYKDNFKDNLTNYLSQTGQVDDEGVKQSTNTKDDGRYHSNWLNMMYPRLKLARNLMSDDGVIFISIDDNEVDSLRKICDEVFGELNRLDRGSIIWVNKGSTKGFNRIVKNHEYILCYSKNNELVKSKFGLNYKNDLEELEHYCFNKPNPGNPICDITFKAGCKIEGILDKEFVNYVGEDVRLEIINGKMIFKNGILENDIILRGAFPYRFQIENYFINEINGIKTFDNKGQEWLEIYFNSKGLPRYRKERNTKILSSIIDSKEIPNYGSSRIAELLEKKEIFSFPKPFQLIKTLADYFVTENDLILDFFSGSSTTADAVMTFNSITENKVKYICVQLPEITDEKSEAYEAGYKNLTEIGKERIRRAGNKILSEKKEVLKVLQDKMLLTEVEQIEKEKLEHVIKKLDIGFKVFKLDSSNIEAWDTEMPKTAEEAQQKIILAEKNIKAGRKENDLLYEFLLKQGHLLTAPIEEKKWGKDTIYNVNQGELFVCLADKITTELVTIIGEWAKEYISNSVVDLKPVLILKDSAFDANDSLKTNAELTLCNQFGFAKINTI
jgi:adenine-specific DNA-methyltransferase